MQRKFKMVQLGIGKPEIINDYNSDVLIYFNNKLVSKIKCIESEKWIDVKIPLLQNYKKLI